MKKYFNLIRVLNLIEMKCKSNLNEMPHYDSYEFGLIDLNIEKYKVSYEEKNKYLKANLDGNLYGYYKNKNIWLRFVRSEVYKVKNIPKDAIVLPKNWYEIATILPK